jgi:methionyl-tRNA synthetase
MINYDHFSEVDIRIATILSAEKIPEGDKLLKLRVSIGEEERQIMAGIAEHIEEPAALVGRQIPIIANLEPRTLRGYESHGMILAADSENGPVLIHPDSKVSDGAKVK